MQGVKEDNKGAVNILLVIGLLILAFVLFFGISFIVLNTLRMSKWDKEPLAGSVEKEKVAREELLIPDFSDYMQSQSSTGMRDTTYAFESVWFDSLEELFQALPYESDKKREQAMEDYSEMAFLTEDMDRISELEQKSVKIYKIPDGILPLEHSDKRKDGWENGCLYEYYILLDENNQARLLCMKVGY